MRKSILCLPQRQPQLLMEKSRKLIANILKQLGGLKASRRRFMEHVFLLILTLRGRHNFLGLSRYGNYNERSYRTNYEQDFDFLTYNILLSQHHLSKKAVLALDPSYLPKSGKCTPHLDSFYSGCASKSLKGLEITGVALIDLTNNTGFHLLSVQTPDKATLKAKNWTRVDHYAEIITSRSEQLEQLADYLCVDGYFAKKKFIDAVMNETSLHLICKLRSDANLKYISYAKPTGKPGRPRLYDGKVNTEKIDKRRIKNTHQNEHVNLYEGVVYHSQLKRKIKLCYVEFLTDGKPNGKVQFLFSTDLELGALEIYRYYKARFQIEFIFRDAKQFTGLSHCQARSTNKLHFHHNASLTAVNIAKATYHLNKSKEERKAFSMANVKTELLNEYMLEIIIANLEIDPNSAKIRKLRCTIRKLGKIAA